MRKPSKGMRLAAYPDYALRPWMYLALKAPDPATIGEGLSYAFACREFA
jgi:hypothetical protein